MCQPAPHIVSFRRPEQLDDERNLVVFDRSEIRVVSLDLDNTLWNTSATIATANDALAAYLDANKIVQPKRVEKVMGDLFAADKERYSPIEKQQAKSPVLLTKLRKDAIAKVLVDSNGFDDEDASAMAERAFQEWTNARHKAIPDNLAESVVECIERVAQIRTSAGHPVLIGAITDGNSDPRILEDLGGYFDFCINAERVGISKPDKRVYLSAIAQVIEHPHLQDLVDPNQPHDEVVGPWWVHIGDDFVKDVVAAKELGMRSVWSRELVLGKLQAKQATDNTQSGSTRSVEDLVKEVSKMKIVRMQVGSDDYLVDSFQREFADAVIDRFADLAGLLHDWHGEALAARQQSNKSVEEPQRDNAEGVPATATPTDTVNGDSTSAKVADEPAAVPSASGKAARFCLYCGEKLPVAAKFCSSCGEKQTME